MPRVVYVLMKFSVLVLILGFIGLFTVSIMHYRKDLLDPSAVVQSTVYG